MTEPTSEAETEEFTDELSDEALDREEGAILICPCVPCASR
jgi:hypothetical protein